MKQDTTFTVSAYAVNGRLISRAWATAPADPHTPEAAIQAEEIIDDLDRMAGPWLADQGARRVEVRYPPDGLALGIVHAGGLA